MKIKYVSNIQPFLVKHEMAWKQINRAMFLLPLTFSFSLPSPNRSTKTLGKNKSGQVYRQFHFTHYLGHLGCDNVIKIVQVL